MRMNENNGVSEMHAHLHTQLNLTGHSQRRIKNKAPEFLKCGKLLQLETWEPPKLPS